MIFGTVLGSVTAHDRIEVRRSGSVEGNVACARLVVQDGAILCGKVETRGERRPRKTTTEQHGASLPDRLTRRYTRGEGSPVTAPPQLALPRIPTADLMNFACPTRQSRCGVCCMIA